MKEWWQNLTKREQLTLGVGGIILGIILFYIFIWSPFSNKVASLRSDVITQRSLLVWMQSATTELKSLQESGNSSEIITPSSLLPVISKSLKENNLDGYIADLAQTENNKVKIKFPQVPFDQLIAWLTQLWQKYNIKTTQINIKNTSTSGVVAAEAVVEVASNAS